MRAGVIIKRLGSDQVGRLELKVAEGEDVIRNCIVGMKSYSPPVFRSSTTAGTAAPMIHVKICTS